MTNRFDRTDADYSDSHITVYRVPTHDDLPPEARQYDIGLVACTEEHPDGTIHRWMDGQWHWAPLATFPGQYKPSPTIAWAPPQVAKR